METPLSASELEPATGLNLHKHYKNKHSLKKKKATNVHQYFASCPWKMVSPRTKPVSALRGNMAALTGHRLLLIKEQQLCVCLIFSDQLCDRRISNRGYHHKRCYKSSYKRQFGGQTRSKHRKVAVVKITADRLTFFFFFLQYPAFSVSFE